VKENQKCLLEDVQLLEAHCQPDDTCTHQPQAGHGRIVTRTTHVYNQHINDFILDEDWQEHIKTVVKVQRKYNVFDTKTKSYKQRNEDAWYICNRLVSAQQSSDFSIGHWGIENSNHYVRDVALCEDEARIRYNSDNFAKPGSFTLNILRKQKVDNIKGTLYLNSLNWIALYDYPHLI
jgi:predicted transposase YbfD/YdcC